MRALPRSTTAGRSSCAPTTWSRCSTSAWPSRICACRRRRSSPTAPRLPRTPAAPTRTTTWRSSTRRAARELRRCGTCARTASWCRREHPRRNQRLQLRGLAGKLLSRGSLREEDARVLRGEVRQRRDQLLVLPEAHGKDPRGVGGAGARALPLRAEGLAADHAPEAAARLRGIRHFVRRRGPPARSAARAGALPAAAQSQVRPAAVARLPPPA